MIPSALFKEVNAGFRQRVTTYRSPSLAGRLGLKPFANILKPVGDRQLDGSVARVTARR